jgi:hypothetical protein
MTDNERRLAEHDEKVRNRPPKHPRWNELNWAVGYIDHHGAVHGTLLFQDDPNRTAMHAGLFPNLPRYKLWRWNRSRGFITTQTPVDLDDEEWAAVEKWLLKNGCLNDWEL